MVDGEHLRYPIDVESSSPLFICLLGSFRVLSWGRPVEIPYSSKVEALVTALVLHNDHCIPRDSLSSMLWPDQEYAHAGQSLDSLIYSVRKQFREMLDGASPILRADSCYALNYEAGVTADVIHFDALVRRGNVRWQGADLAQAVTMYSAAIELYRGELRGGSDLSTTIERERLRVAYLSILARLADFHYAGSQYAQAQDFAHRILVSDPCREDAHRMMMRCYTKLGQRAEALRQYQLCSNVLRSEFDASPETATLALFEQIRLDPSSV